MDKDMKYPTLFVAGWVAWACVYFLVEVLWVDSVFMWLLVIGSFLVLEGLAIRNKARGDTLSEQVWALYGGKSARLFVVLGFATHIFIRMITLGDYDFPGHILLGRLALFGGIFVWLILHFIKRGKEG